MGTPVFWQTGFRLRNDNGSETDATWIMDQNTSGSLQASTNFRVRFLIDEQNGAAWSNKTFNLYASKNGAAYAAVTGATDIRFAASTNFTDGADTTSQLTGGVGVFVTDNNGMKETTGGVVNSGSKNQLFEAEFCLQIVSGTPANTTFDLRLYDSSSALASYTQTPRIRVIISQTYNEAASAIKQDGVTVSGVFNPAFNQIATQIKPGLVTVAGIVYEETIYDS